MFNQNVAIVVGETTTNYGLVSVQGSDSVRQNAAAEINAPDFLKISHETKGKNGSAIDRHMIRIDTTYAVSLPDGGTSTATATAYAVLIVPHSVATKANVKAAYAKLAAFIGATESGASSTNLDRLLNSEP